MRALVLCALGLVASSAWSADEAAAYATLQSCGEHAAGDVEGIDELEKLCPGLRAALEELQFPARLPSGWEEKADAFLLSDLAALHSRYSAAPATRGPQLDSLREILAGLKRDSIEQPVYWWDRFKTWLRKLFTPGSSHPPEWLERLIGHLTLSAAVLQIILYGLIALVIGSALFVAYNELRAAGVFGKHRALAGSTFGGSGDTRADAQLTLADFDAASWVERPTILLRLIVARLVELRRLRTERSLTHRELSRRARFEKSVDRDRFEHLSLLAEALRFGSRAERTESELRANAIVTDGKSLLTELSREQRS